MNSPFKPPIEIGSDWIVNRLKDGLEIFIFDFLAALPILLGVAIGVYALVGMISKTLAKLGVGGVFLYGGFIILI